MLATCQAMNEQERAAAPVYFIFYQQGWEEAVLIILATPDELFALQQEDQLQALLMIGFRHPPITLYLN